VVPHRKGSDVPDKVAQETALFEVGKKAKASRGGKRTRANDLDGKNWQKVTLQPNEVLT